MSRAVLYESDPIPVNVPSSCKRNPPEILSHLRDHSVCVYLVNFTARC
uniref:Uncharacterized protein n=1 Tax=Anguilla anguilla TaxID=7936 RepID=A0A0E9VKF8_ANGAN